MEEMTTYKVGDTVLLETASREPSVAVIVSIWKVFEGECEDFVNVRLHWFSRLSDLARSSSSASKWSEFMLRKLLTIM